MSSVNLAEENQKVRDAVAATVAVWAGLTEDQRKNVIWHVRDRFCFDCGKDGEKFPGTCYCMADD